MPVVKTASMGDAAIRVRGLHKAYGSFEAVAGVDLDVFASEIFALLGPNGAGKTTITEILEGYRARDSGEVSVLGVDSAHGDRHWRARIGIVLQSGSVNDELTVSEIVHHFASYYPTPRDPDEVIDAVGLDAKRSSRVGKLSGGLQRRLDVALGVVGRPELLFLDEPTTGFDPEARRQFWGLIQRLRGEGTTILLTTHYLEEAEALADRVGVLSRGRLIEVGPPATLGGRAEASAKVSWVDQDGPHEITTMEPTRLVTELATRFGGEIPYILV
jgi:ABC-2 type transport system ATP-binding protein